MAKRGAKKGQHLASQVEMASRIILVAEMIAKGWPSYRMVAAIREKWKLAERTARKYIADAFETLRDPNDETIEKLRNKARRQRERVLEEAWSKFDSASTPEKIRPHYLDTIQRTLDSLARIDGLADLKIKAEVSHSLDFRELLRKARNGAPE